MQDRPVGENGCRTFNIVEALNNRRDRFLHDTAIFGITLRVGLLGYRHDGSCVGLADRRIWKFLSGSVPIKDVVGNCIIFLGA